METKDNKFWLQVALVSASILIAIGFFQATLESKIDAAQAAKICEHEINEHATPRETGIIISTDIKYIKRELAETHDDIKYIKKIIISKLVNEE